MTKFPTYGFVVFCLIFSGCKKDAEYTNVREDVFKTPLLPEELYDYSSETAPQHFIDDPVLQLFGTFEGGNGITDEGATLGRVLFYDKALSSDNTVSCSSCHDQQHAFSDPNRFSEGVNGTTSRNSMAIFNMRLNRRFFWDTRANSIQQQVLMPIQDELEMNMPLDQLEEKLAQIDYYPGLFEAAFGDAEINSGRIATALAMFVRSITSYNSPYDEGRQNGFANFTAEEQAGLHQDTPQFALPTLRRDF